MTSRERFEEWRDIIDCAIRVLRQVENGDGVFVGQCADAISGLESIAAYASEAIDAAIEQSNKDAELKLTPWFNSHVLPAYVGVYKVRTLVVDRFGTLGFEYGFAKWNGYSWSPIYCSVIEAERALWRGSFRKQWRGLAENPETGHRCQK